MPKWPSFRVGDAFCRKLGLFAWIDIRERLAVGIADFKATGYHALPLPNVTQGLSGARNGLSSFPNLELNEDMLDVRFDGLAADTFLKSPAITRSGGTNAGTVAL